MNWNWIKRMLFREETEIIRCTKDNPWNGDGPSDRVRHSDTHEVGEREDRGVLTIECRNCNARWQPRIWGLDKDGTPHVTGMTVADLCAELSKFEDTDEVCMVVCQKKNWNGGGLSGKLKDVTSGSTGQIWLKALVLDESQE